VGHNTLLDDCVVFCANDLLFFLVIPIVLLWGLPSRWRRRTIRPEEAVVLHENRNTLIWMVCSCALAMVISSLVANFVFEPRPFVSHHVTLLFSHPADDSFPSDHATMAFAICGMFLFGLLSELKALRRLPDQATRHGRIMLRLLRKPILLSCVVVVVCCLIGVARVCAGVHYPGDILAGAFDGIVAAALVSILARRLPVVTTWVLHFAQRLHLA